MDSPVALITGAGKGIGRATAGELARRGYRLVLVARNEADLRETAESSDPAALVLAADVTETAKLPALVAAAVERFGRVDALINNAGYAPVRSIEDLTPQDWATVIYTNLTAAVFLSKACWPHFRKQNGGVIVNISSASARDPFMGFAAYGAAKAGLNLLTLALAREGQPIGVRVHSVAPSAVETGMFRSIPAAKDFPTEQTLSPSQVATVIADCITGALAYTSGEVIWLHKTL